MMKTTYLLIVLIAATTWLGCAKEKTVDTGSTVPQAVSITNVAYGADALQKMDVYLPQGRSADSTKVLLLIHGGAWVEGDKSDFAAFVDTIKKRLPGYAIFNINYRLSAFPANVFPTQELDIKAAVNFIDSQRANYMISDKWIMMGASAGAHLALLHAYKYPAPVKIKAVVDFFGPTNLVELYNNPGIIPPSAIASIIGFTPAQNLALYQQSSPVNYVNSAACATIILQGTADLLVNHISQSQALYNLLNAAAVPSQYVVYANKGHGDWDAATFADAFTNIQAFVQRYNP